MTRSMASLEAEFRAMVRVALDQLRDACDEGYSSQGWENYRKSLRMAEEWFEREWTRSGYDPKEL